MGQDDQIGLVGTLAPHLIGLTLQHCINADAGLGQQARHTRKHTGLVGHPQSKVVAGADFAHGQHRQSAHRAGLKGQMRHPVERVHRVQARHIHQIGNHRTGGRLTAGPLAVIQGGPHRIALHHHRVHGALDIGDQALGGNQARMNPQLNALGGPLGDPQQLDAITQLLRISDVLRLQSGDALHIGLVKLHRDAKGYGRHEGGLVGRVHALDVKGGVGLGVAQPLRLFQDRIEAQAFAAHLREDEVGGAVDNAGNPFNAIGGQSLAQRLDDGNAAGHGRLKRDHHALVGCRRKNLGAMHRQQGFVGSHHMLARRNGLEHQLSGHAVATDQLHHDIDLGVCNHRAGIAHHRHRITHNPTRTLKIQIGHDCQLNVTAGAPGDFLPIASQDGVYTATDGTDAQQSHTDRSQVFFAHDVSLKKSDREGVLAGSVRTTSQNPEGQEVCGAVQWEPCRLRQLSRNLARRPIASRRSSSCGKKTMRKCWLSG